MSKTLNEKNLSERPAIRTLLAISLCASMVAFGCTTDRTVSNGDPVVTPGVRTTPTGATTGGESEALPPPMMSSSNVMPRALLVTPAQAAVIMASHQPPRVKVLGTVSPGNVDRSYQSDRVSSAVPAYGQIATVNSSIRGQQSTGIASGAGEPLGGDPDVQADFLETIGALDPGFDLPPDVGNGATLNPTSNISTTPATTNVAAPVVSAPAATAATPTASSINNTSGTSASVRTLSPTAATVVNPPASISGSPTLAATSSARIAGTSTVRVVNTNGRVVVTNSNSSRQQ